MILTNLCGCWESVLLDWWKYWLILILNDNINWYWYWLMKILIDNNIVQFWGRRESVLLDWLNVYYIVFYIDCEFHQFVRMPGERITGLMIILIDIDIGFDWWLYWLIRLILILNIDQFVRTPTERLAGLIAGTFAPPCVGALCPLIDFWLTSLLFTVMMMMMMIIIIFSCCQ